MFDHSDTDNAKRLLAHFGRDLAIVQQEGVAGGDWAAWADTHWDLAGGMARATVLAQRIGGRIALEAAHLDHTPDEKTAIKRAREYSESDDGEDARKARMNAKAARAALASRKGARWRFAVTSKNKARYCNMMDAAAPHLRRHADSFNADPHKVACLSHTLVFEPDIANGGWCCLDYNHHRREDYITALVPHPFEPRSVRNPRDFAPKWLAFLERLLPDKDKRRTVQAFAGACLLGTPLQRIMFHYGAGANGKSVFLETLTQVLGESFAIGLPPESIAGSGERGAGAASPDIARMFGKRMARVLELPEGKKLQEDLIKRLTGGEKFPVRSLYKGYFEFVNRAKPHMSGNGFPYIEGTDHGIWRRMLVVHWDVTIPEPERREFEVVVGELVKEGSGILGWLIAGALDFLENGLFVAPAIVAATEEYRADMDPIGEFFGDCVKPLEGGAVQARVMHQAYLAWSAANAKKPSSEAKFGREIKKRLKRAERAGANYWLECILHNVPSAPEGGGYPDDYGH